MRAPIDPATRRAVAQAGVGLVTSTVAWAILIPILASGALGSLILLGPGPLRHGLGLVERAAALERRRLHLQFGAPLDDPVLRPDPASSQGTPGSASSQGAARPFSSDGVADHTAADGASGRTANDGATAPRSSRGLVIRAARAVGRGRRGSWTVVADPRRWAQVAYLPLGWAANLVEVGALAALGAGAVLVAMPALNLWVGQAPTRHPWALPAGLVVIWAGAVACQLLARLHVALARGLLGADRNSRERARLVGRVDQLTRTRARAVDAADAERRRIERDLHDGVQQRLVALMVELGMARRHECDDQVLRPVVDHAHGEVRAILADLRNLVRGIHPAVLADRGLGAALAALAARSPIPVEVSLGPVSSALDGAPDAGTAARVATGLGDPAPPAASHLRDRPARGAADLGDPAAQTAAYFVVAEALTNAARHSGAQRIGVEVDVVGGRLHVLVQDDGVGGACEPPGGGLQGLRDRLAALDGTLTLTSPPGGGTRIEAVI